MKMVKSMLEGKVLKIEKGGKYFTLSIETEAEFDSQPGQFVMLGLPDNPITLKPFSIMKKHKAGFDLLVKKVGKFSEKLSNLSIGGKIKFRGAYGVPYHKKLDQSKKYVLLGGGSGAAPLIYFSTEFPFMVDDAFYGFKNADVSKILGNVGIVDEASSGKNVLQIAYELIFRKDPERIGIILCGPKKMIQTASELFKKFKIYVSLEERMGCGIGMCMGCPVKTTHGIKKVCKDGPIFDLEEVTLEW